MKDTSSLIMMPFSVLYSAVTRGRLAAYRSGLFSTSRLSAPVISVGNITTGGTGKTPLVEWICRAIARECALEGSPKKICVLTRGYGRENPESQVIVSNGAEILAHERQAGDEALLIARNLLGTAAVIANANRVAAGEWAIKNLGAEVFVLDDGFQHLRIARDLNIVAIDATNPWGDGALLPHGRLREEQSGLSRADCVIITRADQVENVNYLKRSIQNFAGGVPIFTSRMMTSGVQRLTGGAVDNDVLAAQPLGAFCGVGNPDSFFTQLERQGARLVFTKKFPDHHVYRQVDLDSLTNNAKAAGAAALVTTAKDAVKLASHTIDLPCYVLEIAAAIGEEEQLVRMICAAVSGTDSQLNRG